MKTAGQLLRDKRLLLELSLADIAQKIKVKESYLQALENSDFLHLPSGTFTKGFLSSYAKVLHLNPETILAMFRRDFSESHTGEIIPSGLVKPVLDRHPPLPVNLILLITCIVVFLTFLGFQLFSWWSLPKLNVLEPQDGETYGEKITVKGLTAPDATVIINDQKVIVGQNGEFSLDLLFPAGTHRVLIQAQSREGKTRLLERTFTVSK